jgi:imidazole glycerol-phosphate synthase subunit HisH
MMISIIDYGMGNLGSIVNMYKKIGVKTQLVSDVSGIEKSAKILLPGVGSFDAAMKRIDQLGIRDILNEKALKEKVPILGICLGMQLLTMGSEEGNMPGFGWIPAYTKDFKKALDTQIFKVPHMGWGEAKITQKSPLTRGFESLEELRFYFVHSYYVKCDIPKDSILKSNYGVDFDSAIQRENIYGAQFHPEKSHKFGMKLLENFSSIQ